MAGGVGVGVFIRAIAFAIMMYTGPGLTGSGELILDAVSPTTRVASFNVTWAEGAMEIEAIHTGRNEPFGTVAVIDGDPARIEYRTTEGREGAVTLADELSRLESDPGRRPVGMPIVIPTDMDEWHINEGAANWFVASTTLDLIFVVPKQ